MLLVVDIGNTDISFGLVRAGALVTTRRARTRPGATPDELELVLEGLLRLDGLGLADVSAMALASVVPPTTVAFQSVAERHAIPMVIATAGVVPIPARVDRPSEVGADRLVNALAAGRLVGTPAIVVDLGTATTLDCVASDGAYVGGAIAPGLALGLDALADRTAMLPRVELRMPDRVIARDTVSAIEAGAVLGHAVLVAGLVRRARRELADAAGIDPSAVHVVLTGGLSNAAFAKAVEGIDVIDPDLTLKGLAILHAQVTAGDALELGLG